MGADPPTSVATLAFGLLLEGVLPPWTTSFEGSSVRRRLRCRFASTSGTPDDPWWIREEEQSLVVGWRDYAEYRIDAEAGSVDTFIGRVDQAEASLGLLLSALPLALPLFDLEPLHGSCLLVPGLGGLVILGGSGSGKSTLGAQIATLGASFLADDATAIDTEGRVVPGPPVANPRFLDAGQPAIGTYNGKVIRLVRDSEPSPATLGAVVFLDPQEGFPLSVETLSTREAFTLGLANVRMPWLFRSRRQARQIAVGSLLAELPGVRVRFDPAKGEVVGTAESVLRWAQDL